MSIDLGQFHQVFFEESLEGLDEMEQQLLAIDVAQFDSESINTIFRAAHSIKGGASTFGFTDIASFTHILETLLDEVREQTRQLSVDMVDLLLKSGDCLRDMITALQHQQDPDLSVANELSAKFTALLHNDDQAAKADKSLPPTAGQSQVADSKVIQQPSGNVLGEFISDALHEAETPQSLTGWQIDFKPEPQILQTGNEPLRIFNELADLGDLRVEANVEKLPPLHDLIVDECYLSWRLYLSGNDISQEAIDEVFEWVIDDCELTITALSSDAEVSEPENKPDEKDNDTNISSTQVLPDQTLKTDETAAVNTASAVVKPKPEKTEKVAPTEPANASIRVGIDKVDSLINLVGELVITQSMLSELGDNFDMSKLERLSGGLEQLMQNTRELQESVMRIRMLPISFVFNRFPRMIRDLAQKTQKQVHLELLGESTELDKTVMEKISDPMVHLVRNAIDHGIETAQEREQQGKSPEGNITLNAYHNGGNIVVEITDDGRGLNAEKLAQKAIEKGVIASVDGMSETEIFDLIFEPGFSTAAVVSDISGRGVGMDVVRKNIKQLGGRIEVASQLGQGSTFKIHLPLTLAILDGQLVRVGQQTYVIPLLSIVESLQIKAELVSEVSGNVLVYALREEHIPIITLADEFGITGDHNSPEEGLLVVVEGEGHKVGLLVDDLLAQQQVVIKSLETNYHRLDGLSGATILGNGAVALILDIASLIDFASRRARQVA